MHYHAHSTTHMHHTHMFMVTHIASGQMRQGVLGALHMQARSGPPRSRPPNVRTWRACRRARPQPRAHARRGAPRVDGQHQTEAGVRAQHALAAARRAGLVQQQLAAGLQQRVQPVQHLRARRGFGQGRQAGQGLVMSRNPILR